MALTPNKYQTEAAKTFGVDGIKQVFRVDDNPSFEDFDEELAHKNFSKLVYATLGLTGEAGEFAEEVKKTIRIGGDIKERREDMIAELGDVLWYLAACATTLGVPLEDIMEKNLGKVRAKQRNRYAK